MQLDIVTPQPDVVSFVGGLAKGQRESEPLDVKVNGLSHVAGAENRLDLTEDCGVHKNLLRCSLNGW
jgi:hypothetical protein